MGWGARSQLHAWSRVCWPIQGLPPSESCWGFVSRGVRQPQELPGALRASRLRVRPQPACTTQQKVIFALDNNEVFLCLTRMCSPDWLPFGKALKSLVPIPFSQGLRVTICALLLPGGDVLGTAALLPGDSGHPRLHGRKEGGNASQELWLQLVDGLKGREGCGNGRRMSGTLVSQPGKPWAQPGRLRDPQPGQGARKGLRAVPAAWHPVPHPRAAVSPEDSSECRMGLLAPAWAPSLQPPWDSPKTAPWALSQPIPGVQTTLC